MKRPTKRKDTARFFVGLNKWGHDASACLITKKGNGLDVELVLKERLIRKKSAAGTIEVALLALRGKIDPRATLVAENSYIGRPPKIEKRMSSVYPAYFEQLKDFGLELFYRQLNPEVHFVTHHLCHARAAAEVSPFRKSAILVIDGAGSAVSHFDSDDPEIISFRPLAKAGDNHRKATEWCSIYLQNGTDLTCVAKSWQLTSGPAGATALHAGLGIFYEQAARYIFHSNREAGKVMGLAPYGRPVAINDPIDFYRELDGRQAFKKSGKQAWEGSGHFKLYSNIAASTQAYFEKQVLKIARQLRHRFPEYTNLILTGGCALNCVANAKLAKAAGFRQIYVPPFPSDESISFGAAAMLLRKTTSASWKPVAWQRQRANFGPKSSIPSPARVRKSFREFKIDRLNDIAHATAQLLAEGKVVGWFQDRSESGPRALGFRSILASPLIPGMKAYLNEHVKGREAFRPYGASCVWDKAHIYFEVCTGFESPFMSFAVKVRRTYAKRLAAITHVDGTSRIQTVHREQNPHFYRLIREFEKATGVACLLNTSMNIMGEPIVETVEDARRFFDITPVDAIVLGDFLIQKHLSRP